MNPSFEEYYKCPTGSANIEDCKHVFNPMCANSQAVGCISTPDYFNACSTVGDNSNVPYTVNGYQQAKDGDAFIGFFDGGFYREYIQIKLSESLVKGNAYSFSFYANLADYSNIKTNQVGLKFVMDSTIHNQYYLWETMSADWVSNEYITDTTGWQQLSGEYVAKGGEQWVIIGNFYQDSIFPSIVVNKTTAPSWLNYYYINIDRFFIKKAPIHLPNVFTPNGDGTNDVWITGGDVKEVQVLNRWGNIVFKSGNDFQGWNGTTQNGTPCTAGMYYYVIKEENNTTHKGFIELIR